jgi:hypothetical protein
MDVQFEVRLNVNQARSAAMSTTTQSAVRELHRRVNDGFDVRLLWDPETNRVFVSVEDQRHADSFEIEVHPADALEAFYHPFAYTDDHHANRSEALSLPARSMRSEHHAQ